jgi:hypothetical protein
MWKPAFQPRQLPGLMLVYRRVNGGPSGFPQAWDGEESENPERFCKKEPFGALEMSSFGGVDRSKRSPWSPVKGSRNLSLMSDAQDSHRFVHENWQVPVFPLVSLGKARRDAPHSVIAKFNRNVEFNMATPLKAGTGGFPGKPWTFGWYRLQWWIHIIFILECNYIYSI